MRFIFIIILITAVTLIAGEKESEESALADQQNPVSFNNDKFNLIQMANDKLDDEMTETRSRKSGIKAALLSGLIPGAGEVYAKSYWRAAVFAGLEITFISFNRVYENKGDDEDKRMKAYGDEHWLPQRYWSKVYDVADKSGLWDYEPLEKKDDYLISDAEFNNPTNIRRLRELEDDIGYTHTLPSTKTQQYYEMIYKYLHQFGVAWDDVTALTGGDEEAAWNFYNSDNLGNLSPHTKEYRSIRNQSNDYYATATTMLNLLLLNHVLSAFDAAFAVKQFNKKINYAVRVNSQYSGYERVTTYGLYVSW
ncbi:MAG: hypothetical protein P8X42_11490 [Calditrichaceae bacterium]